MELDGEEEREEREKMSTVWHFVLTLKVHYYCFSFENVCLYIIFISKTDIISLVNFIPSPISIGEEVGNLMQYKLLMVSNHALTSEKHELFQSNNS